MRDGMWPWAPRDVSSLWPRKVAGPLPRVGSMPAPFRRKGGHVLGAGLEVADVALELAWTYGNCTATSTFCNASMWSNHGVGSWAFGEVEARGSFTGGEVGAWVETARSGWSPRPACGVAVHGPCRRVNGDRVFRRWCRPMLGER